MSVKTKKLSGVWQRHLGQHQKFGRSAAFGSYTKSYSSARLPSPADFYAAAIEGFAEYDDDWAWGCCPFHDDHNPSFCMNLRTGWYECKSSSCGETGKSIVSFVCARDGLSKAEAIRYLEGWV